MALKITKPAAIKSKSKKTTAPADNKVTVTFSLKKAQVPENCEVFIVGEFNNWSKTETPMENNGKGVFKAEMKLDAGKSYQFRYYFSNDSWANEEDASRQVTNEFGDSNNSVIDL